MSDDGSKDGTAALLPKFHFRVTLPPLAPAGFSEVSALDHEAQALDYRSGAGFDPGKMPGVAKYGTVELKRGVFAATEAFWHWRNALSMNTIRRETVTIELLDETGKPSMVWTLANAWPTKITGTDLKSEGNEIAVETLELAHEGLTIASV